VGLPGTPTLSLNLALNLTPALTRTQAQTLTPTLTLTLSRWATEEGKRSPHVTLKDLDLKHELALPPWMLDKFQKQVNDDCGWLRSLGIMDYSLLMLVRAVCVPCACRVRAVCVPCACRVRAVCVPCVYSASRTRHSAHREPQP
jgi:hypothetical protein